MNWKKYYSGKTLLIATKHQKELVIGPLFQQEFGFQYAVSDRLDTDMLGTFSGEIERKGSPLQVLRQKCEMAMDLHGEDVAIASEGSFGAHPHLLFAPADTELLMFKDRQNGIEIWVQKTSTETNFSGLEIHSTQEIPAFLAQVKFPSHALILKKSKDDLVQMHKGIKDEGLLYSLVDQYLKNSGSCFLETDMRAMNNPTRMGQIEQLTHQLIQKMNSLCPSCSFPGFSIMEVQGGLLCSQCFLPTQSILKEIYRCQKCLHEEEKLYPASKYLEGPMYCDYCNP